VKRKPWRVRLKNHILDKALKIIQQSNARMCFDESVCTKADVKCGECKYYLDYNKEVS
jgi:hypothetical protein